MSSNVTCGAPPSTSTLNFGVYNIGALAYFILAVSGHSLLLFAFMKQGKSQRTYMYQVYCAVARSVEILFRTLYFISMQVLLYGYGARTLFDTFQNALVQCYACAWYSVHLAVPAASSCAALSLFLSVAMAADRVTSLLQPMAYKNMRHDRNRRIVLVVCISIAFGMSAFDCWRSMVATDGQGRYFATSNTSYTKQYLVQILALIRVAIQAAALLALVSLSVILCYLYRMRFVNAKAKMTNTTESNRSKEKERTLLLLTFVECSLVAVAMGMQMVYYTITYGYPEFYTCWQSVMTKTADVCHMILDVSHFYIFMLISLKFRLMIKRAVCSCLGRGGTVSSGAVGPSTVAPHGQVVLVS